MNSSRLWVSLYLYSGSDHVHGVGEGGGCSCSHRSGHGLQEEVRTVHWSQSGQLLCKERERQDFTVTVHVQRNSGGGAFLIHTNSGVPCTNLHTYIKHLKTLLLCNVIDNIRNTLYNPLHYTQCNIQYTQYAIQHSTQRTHEHYLLYFIIF